MLKVDSTLPSSLLNVYENLTFKKVQIIAAFLIFTAVASIAASAYFGITTKTFFDVRVISFSLSAIPLLAVALLLLNLRPYLLALLKKTDLEWTNYMFTWQITYEEGQKIEDSKYLIKIKEGIDGIESMLEFAELCDDFKPIDVFKGKMDAFFTLIDPKRKVRNVLKQNVIQCIKDHGFAELAKEFQKLEKRISWSFFDLLDEEEQKKLFFDYLKDHDDETDFLAMYINYWDIATRLLPEEVLRGTNLSLPNPSFIYQKWHEFKRGEVVPSEIM